MFNGYISRDYIEEDYYEDEQMSVTPLPTPPVVTDPNLIFAQKGGNFLSALPQFALELDAVTKAMNNNSTNATSITSHTIANSGSKVFVAQPGKGYLPGQTVKAAVTADGTIWMQGDVTAYDFSTGEVAIEMNASQGSGTFANWTLTMATSVANATGSLSQDYAVKSLTHAIGSAIASASTINLSTATGNLAHVTGNTGINAATMTAGKDVWVIFDGTPILGHHATNHKLNNNGSNITATAGSMALYTFDGTTVRVFYFAASGKANTETAAPPAAPVGSCLIHFGSSAPTNYLVCPVSLTNVSRTTYATLFAAIGTAWGSGDGSTTFALPWFAPGYTLLQANSNVGSSYTGDVKAHTHSGVPLAMVEDDRGSLASSWALNSGDGTTGSTGGAANYAAGMRVLICVRYQ